MTVVHTYFYIVVDTQRGCRTLKITNPWCLGLKTRVSLGLSSLDSVGHLSLLLCRIIKRIVTVLVPRL